MFWRRGKTKVDQAISSEFTYEEAKEATRRAAFLNVAQGMTEDVAYRQQLTELFRVCRSAALAAGKSRGLSEEEIDATISAQCDSDATRLKHASDDEFRDFARESGAIVNQFLSKV